MLLIFNPDYFELQGRELRKDRMREAETERLIKLVSGCNPPFTRKLMVILQSRWKECRIRVFPKRGFDSIAHLPKKSPSL